MNYGTVDDPREAGYDGTFYAKAVAGCPACKHELVEPDTDMDCVALVCPHCEELLQWLRAKDI